MMQSLYDAVALDRNTAQNVGRNVDRNLVRTSMQKGVIAFFLCVALPFSGAFAGQQANTTKPAANSKAAEKNSATYSKTTAAKTQFMRETGYRNGRPGYVVAYRKPLACGGTEDTSNLQWLTAAEAQAKDKTERKGCK
jgi:hypothetical protein